MCIIDRRYQERVEHQANEDYLTGLYNRMRFEEDLNKEIHATVRSGGESAVLYIDLDDFNHINDALGHHVGDLLLQNVADALVHVDGVKMCIRDSVHGVHITISIPFVCNCWIDKLIGCHACGR